MPADFDATRALMGDADENYDSRADYWKARAVKAEAERDALLADAERYRWLRNHGDEEIDGIQMQITCYKKEEAYGLLYYAADAAIDAAQRKP